MTNKVTTLEAYDRYIAYIRHENELMHQRTTWFLALQSLISAGFGFVTYQGFPALLVLAGNTDKPEQTDKAIQTSVATLGLLIPCALVGLVTAMAAYRAIHAARHAQTAVNKLWKRRYADAAANSGLPPLLGGGGEKWALDGGELATSLSILAASTWGVACGVLLLIAGYRHSDIWEVAQWNAAGAAFVVVLIGLISWRCWIVTRKRIRKDDCPEDPEEIAGSPPKEAVMTADRAV